MLKLLDFSFPASWPEKKTNLPYILDTSKLPEGEYILQIISQPDGKEPLVDAIKLIVSK